MIRLVFHEYGSLKPGMQMREIFMQLEYILFQIQISGLRINLYRYRIGGSVTARIRLSRVGNLIICHQLSENLT